MLDCEKYAASLAALPTLTLKRILRLLPLEALAKVNAAGAEVMMDRLNEAAEIGGADISDIRKNTRAREKVM